MNHYGPNASFDGYDSDLASAGILIESLRQQLAEAQAACSMKDELITDACTAIAFYGEQPPQELFDALSMPCDDSALRAWLGEPVGEVKKHTGSLKDMAIIVWTGKQPEEGTNLYSPKGLK